MRKIHKYWGIAAGVLGLIGLALCLLGVRTGTLWVKTDRDPGKVVSAFFDELSARNWEKAYARLDNYKSLGLENLPRTGDGRALLAALCDSYDCSLLDVAEQRGGRAEQRIRLRFLDLDALEQRVISGQAADVASALEEADDLMAQEEFSVTLRFDGEAWLIVLDQALLNAIQGHGSGEGTV